MNYFTETAANILGNNKLRTPQIEAYIKAQDHFASSDEDALIVLPPKVIPIVEGLDTSIWMRGFDVNFVGLLRMVPFETETAVFALLRKRSGLHVNVSEVRPYCMSSFVMSLAPE